MVRTNPPGHFYAVNKVARVHGKRRSSAFVAQKYDSDRKSSPAPYRLGTQASLQGYDMQVKMIVIKRTLRFCIACN